MSGQGARGRQGRVGWRAVAAGSVLMLFCGGLWMVAQAQPKDRRSRDHQSRDHHSQDHKPKLASGEEIFRYDTFGDEEFWTGTLRMHEVIQQALDPLTALRLGLKVDADALPDAVLGAILSGQADLEDPATTLALLERDAVVGVVGTVEEVNGTKTLTKVGITCALCHSTVDDSVLPGIGRRLDGWPNRELDPGAIIALSPAISEGDRAVYNSWGPGKYDPRFNLDGQSTPLVIPPAYGLKGVDKATYTADGDITYWNQYVAVTQMGGQGVFIDPRLHVRVVRTPDRVHRALRPLLDYQLSLETPAPPADGIDPELAEMGEFLFHTTARCAECHTGRHYTDVNEGILHDPDEVGQDPAYAERSVTGQYRTTPLRGLSLHAPYFHDGSAATLFDVVDHYNHHLNLELDEAETAALVEFLRTL